MIDFLVDCGLCMINSRIGVNEFTHVSHRWKSVVDYVFIPHEQLLNIEQFQVRLMSDVINELNLHVHGNNKVPDNSLLMWSIAFIKCNGEADADLGSGSNEQITRSIHNNNNIPADFLTTPDSLNMVNETTQKTENNLNQERDINTAYETFTSLLQTEMENTLPKKCFRSHKKSMYQPYWSDDLQCAWDSVCQKEQLWLRWHGSHGEKHKLRESFNRQRKIFDKVNGVISESIKWQTEIV